VVSGITPLSLSTAVSFIAGCPRDALGQFGPKAGCTAGTTTYGRRVHDVPPGLEAMAPWHTTYTSDGRQLTAFLAVPPGPGPHPGIVFNHGSNGLMAAAEAGIAALVGAGYAVLAPIRRGHNGNPGPCWEDLVPSPWGSPEMGEELLVALGGECDDVLAALDHLRADPRIDPGRLAMLGSSYGGVMVMLAAGRHADFRAGISFAGPSITWPDAPALQEVLLAAMATTDVPLLLIEAWDDFSLTPTSVLVGALAVHGKPHETRVYGRIGTDPGDGHGVFNKAVDWWLPDVLRFLSRWVN
jgi:carboxymethylenebutenolidase